jgi:predicted SnoaL-like aldol condensation-catalyzing enzyme
MGESMLTKAGLLQQLADLVNERRPIEVARYFTEDFRLDDASTGLVRTGHAGAQAMMDGVLALAPDVHFEVLDVVEGADRVAVRWRVTGTGEAGPLDVAMIAIYRFVDGRIAEDWGVWSSKPWQPR